VDFLEEKEALELVQYRPAVDDEISWNACDTTNTFIWKVIAPIAKDGIMNKL